MLCGHLVYECEALTCWSEQDGKQVLGCNAYSYWRCPQLILCLKRDPWRRVWDMDTLECVRVLEGHNEAVLALAVGPSFLVSGSYDTTVRFWALDSLRCVRCAALLCCCHDDMALACADSMLPLRQKTL